MRNSILSALGALALMAAGPADAEEPVTLVAAGSLKTALQEVADTFAAATGVEVTTRFGPSGLMREEIEGGAPAHVFASANMDHPRALAEAGHGGPVVLFARNRLCALARPGLAVRPDTLLDVMLDDATRLGTSTPGADPSGDYAWQLFERADALRPGAGAALEGKARQLTGGPDSPAAPEGRNTYAWVMESDRADLFLTYCTNAVLAAREVPDLQIVAIPDALSVGADYGLLVRDGAPGAATRLALHILSPEGQAVLAAHGFDAPALPKE